MLDIFDDIEHASKLSPAQLAEIRYWASFMLRMSALAEEGVDFISKECSFPTADYQHMSDSLNGLRGECQGIIALVHAKGINL
jgi:hypothetical protein